MTSPTRVTVAPEGAAGDVVLIQGEARIVVSRYQLPEDLRELAAFDGPQPECSACGRGGEG